MDRWKQIYSLKIVKHAIKNALIIIILNVPKNVSLFSIQEHLENVVKNIRSSPTQKMAPVVANLNHLDN